MFRRPINRVQPVLPPQAMKTYQMLRPIGWWVFATCEQADCAAWRSGWVTVVPQEQASTARRSGRSFVETAQPGGLVEFRFAAGQACFLAPPADVVGRSIVEVLGRLDGDLWRAAAKRWHKTVVSREPFFLLSGGDWRGNPLGTQQVQFRTAQAWLDDFGEHQDRIADRTKRG